MQKGKKQKTLSIWNISIIVCVILLLLPFCANMLEYSVFAKRFNEQISERNRFVLDTMCNKIDEQLVFVESLSVSLSLNEEVNKIIKNVYLPLDAQKRYILYDFVNNFNFGYMQVDYQSRIYIYFKHIDIVARAGSCQNIDSFCKAFLQSEKEIKKFKKVMNNENIGQYILMDFNGKKNELFYIKSVSGESENDIVNIALHIDKEAISREISNMYLSGNGILAILDKNDNILFEIKGQNCELSDNITSLEKRRDMLTYGIKSSVANWRYVYIIPKAEVYKKVNHSKSLVIFFVLGIFLVSICIGITFFKSNYARINELVQLFKADKKNINEYSFIKENIEHMLSENKKYSESLNGQNSYLKESVMTALLEERDLSGEYAKKEIEKLHFNFAADRFSVIIFAFRYQIDERYPRAFVVENIFSELLERRKIRYHNLKYKGFLVYIIAFDDDNIFIKVQEDIKRTYEFIKKNFSFEFLAASGRYRKTRNGIAASFKEAYRTIEYLTVTNRVNIALFDDVYTAFKKNYFYTQKTEEKLTNLIRINGKDMLHAELVQILKENGLLTSEPDAMRYFVISAENTMCSLLAESGVSIEHVFPDECKFVENIFECNDAEKMREVVFILFESCYERVFSDISPFLDLSDKIVAFIKENYENQMLGIQMIADEFGKSNDYISRRFKSKMNIKINDYINIVRINEAKKYLKTTNELITTISEKVGFANYRTFVRVFTNITGMSPKNYRNTSI